MTNKIDRLKEHLNIINVNIETEILKLPNLKEAHIYCVIQQISAQKYGLLLEKFIQTKYNFIKNNPQDCLGDCSKNGINYEIKVSLGGANHTKFNYVQIRPSHNCDIYIFTAYHLSNENVELEGELFIFKIPKKEIINLLSLYGSYAHGTIKEYGLITIETLYKNNNIEYALRPHFNDNCWKAMLNFKIQETDF